MYAHKYMFCLMAASLAKQDTVLFQGQYKCRQSDECKISHGHKCRAGKYTLTILSQSKNRIVAF